MGKIVWIASYPKSGNTWVRAFLHNVLRQPDAPQDINALTELSTGESGATRYQRHDPRPPGAWSIEDVQRMRPLVHRDIMAEAPGMVFCKTHNAMLAVRGVSLLTPEATAGAIYILRDPRDIAVSYSRHLGRSIDDTIAFMADTGAATGGTETKVFEMHSSWSAHVDFWTRRADPRLHVMRFEEMLASPEQAFAGLAAFLGETPAPERLARAIRFSAFDELRGQEQARGFSEQPAESAGPFFRAGRAGEWREVLSPAQRARIERDHAAMMTRLGYL